MKRLVATVFGIVIAAVLLFFFAFVRTSETKYEEAVALPFEDVLEGDWFYQYVSTGYHHGWFEGTSKETFSPNDPMTRGEFAQILYRYLDQPELRGYENPFEDLVNIDCKHAVIYLNKLRILSGKDATHFAPDEPITREELVTILYRLGGYKVHEEFSPSGKYMDWERVNLWAREAVDWAIHCEILSGMSTTLLAPQEIASRAQAAKMFCVYAEKAGFKTDTENPNRSVVLRVWQAGVDHSKVSETMKKLFNSFEKKTPGVTIEYTPHSFRGGSL